MKLPDLFPAITARDEAPLFSSKRVLSFLIALVQLAALLLLVRNFKIEKASGISELTLLILASFTVHSFVPLRYRPFIMFLTTACLAFFAFGLVSGSLLMLGGLTVIACCHLPVKLWLRIALLLCIGAGMAILRADLFYAPRAGIVVPFLASMFMFRVILYLFELKHQTTEATLWQRISYFFLFPNLCFLLFPIIDYKTSVKTYYSLPDGELWQKGIRWMLRGVTHLVAYRLVYSCLLTSPASVHDLPSLLQYICSSYVLVLRLSGIFHFILGLLCLFGFNLHPVFNNYFLATSFTNLWRRINIYWREFMVKIFFYPVIFKLKKRIPSLALPLTMMCLFAITWFLHNYQWFWIRGYFPLALTDMLFWLVIGSCITINAVLDERALNRPAQELSINRIYFMNMLKMIGMFLFMSVMWSIWSSESVAEWLFMISKGARATGSQIALVLGIVGAIVLFGFMMHHVLDKPAAKRLVEIKPQHTLFLTAPAIAILFCLSLKGLQRQLPPAAQHLIMLLSDDVLNDQDQKSNEKGYYKKLLDGEENATGNIWEVNLKRSKKFSDLDKLLIRRNDILSRTLKPNGFVQMEDHYVQTNSFGMRDQEYTMQKPPHTFRVALLGGSYEMGSGVSNDQVFESIAEKKLNAQDTNATYKKYEILNFALYRYHLLQHVELCNTKVFRFEPDAVIYVAHSGEAWRFLYIYSDFIRNGTPLKYPFLEQIKQLSGVKQTMSASEIQERLKPFEEVMIKWCYLQIAEQCMKHHAKPVWAFLLTTNDTLNNDEYSKYKHMAESMHFLTMDLRDPYGGVKREELQLSKTNTHPNARGHALIAEKFYEEFVKNKRLMMQPSK